MRMGLKPNFLYDHNVLIGVGLGWDFVAEHEWGIKEIEEAFGIGKSKGAGVPRRRTTTFPEENCKWHDWKDGSVGITFADFYPDRFDKQPPGDLRFNEYGAENLAAAWDSRSFGIRTKEDSNKDALEELFDALKRKNAVIGLFGSINPYSNKGLCIFIASRIPSKITKSWKQQDITIDDLKKRWQNESNGLESLLLKAEKEWFSMGNALRDAEGKLLTWLNPREQSKYNAGWFTVEELKQWAEDKGPVMRTD